MRIRLALTEDVPALHEMARRYRDEAAPQMPGIQIDERVIDRTFGKYLATADPSIWVAEKDDGRIVGFMVASIQSYLFMSGLWTMVEILYVLPENRGTRAAPELLACFDRWSQRLGAIMSHGGNANFIHTDRTASLYRKFGFVEAGAAMVKFRSGA